MSPRILKVLTVDDDPIIRQVIIAFFAKHGVTDVWQAENGKEAISVLNANKNINLIVCDLHMPGVDGVEFMDHLRAIGCRIPLLVVSSASELQVVSVEALAKAYLLNFIGALPKPVNFDELEVLLDLSDPEPHDPAD